MHRLLRAGAPMQTGDRDGRFTTPSLRSFLDKPTPIEATGAQDNARFVATLAAAAPLDNTVVAASQTDWLVDAVHPGAPLLITFAFVDWNNKPDFYLFGRSKKLEQLIGGKLNRILLRDRTNRWYLHGVRGLGAHVDAVVEKLQRLIRAIAPGEILCVGESMGAYAAMMYGFLLNADRILCFGPLSSFDPEFARRYHDNRWVAVMEAVAADPPVSGYYDLPRLAREVRFDGLLHVVVGTSAGSGAPSSVNLDMIHAQRFAGLPGTRFHYFPDAEHAVTAWLTQNHKFDEILLRCLFGHESRQIAPWPPTFAPLQPETVEEAQAGDLSVLVDQITEGAPLLLCFADASAETSPRFDLFAETRALENAMGMPLNRVLLRDPRKQWWLRGVAGLGETCDEVAASLRNLVDRMKPAQIICLGNGMGGYAALCFAMLLRADQAIAFAPLSKLDEQFSRVCHDSRYLLGLAALDMSPHAKGPRDLLELAKKTGYAGKIEVIFGTRAAGEGYDAGCQDALHAQRLALLPNARLHAWPDAQGDVVKWLSKQQRLIEVLLQLVDGKSTGLRT